MTPMRQLVLRRRAAWVGVVTAIAAVAALQRRSDIALAAMVLLLPLLACIVMLGVRIRRLRRIIEGDSPVCRERPLGSVAAFALAIALADAVLAGQGIGPWLLIAFALLYYGTRCFAALRKTRLLRVRLLKAVAVLAIGVAALAVVQPPRVLFPVPTLERP